MNPAFSFTPETRVDDALSLIDSYGLEVIKDGLLHARLPLRYCELLRTDNPPEDAFPAIDRAVELRLCRYDHSFDADTSQTRWPFFVEQPLGIRLIVGDQYWLYKFSPGKLYLERQFELQENR